MRSILPATVRRSLSSLREWPQATVPSTNVALPAIKPGRTPTFPSYDPVRPRHPLPALAVQPAVDLAYERVGPPHQINDGVSAVVILPGLLSSAELWRTLSKAVAHELQTPVYALSLRNQGSSSHIPHMSHLSMAADVLDFCRKHRLSNISLLGHSLGAKVAMALALRPDLPPYLLNNIIIGDSAPVDRPLDANVSVFLEGMKDVERRDLSTRQEAIDVLARYTETKLEIRFLLTNLVLKTPGNPADLAVPLRFRVPIENLRQSIAGLGYFPYKPMEAQWPGKVLFLKGSQSEFLNPHSISVAKQLFPNMEMQTLEGGHWLPFDNPKDFVASVVGYLKPPKRYSALSESLQPGL